MAINLINLYIIPVICLIGFAIELVSSITFYKINTSTPNRRRRPIQIYQYLLLYSISDMIILWINFAFGVLNCGSYCSIDRFVSLYFMKEFERYAKIFTCNTLYTFNVLIEFKIACERYEKFVDLKRLSSSTMKRSLSNSSRRCFFLDSVASMSLTLLAISILINIPYIFVFKTEITSDNQVALNPDLNDENPAWLKLIALIYFLKDFVCLSIIFIFNFMLSYSLKRTNQRLSISKKESMPTSNGEHKSDELQVQAEMSRSFNRFYGGKERQVAQMIVFLSALFLVGHLPETFYRINRKLSILLFADVNYLNYYLIISNIISFVSSYFNLLIYLYFSRTFFEQFKKTFLSCFLNLKSSPSFSSFSLPTPHRTQNSSAFL